MLNVVVENSFDKDYKRELKSGLDKGALLEVVNKLKAQEPLEPKNKDHKLKGNYKECRECHIKPDMLLIYRVSGENLHLIRLGSHSELFR